MRISGGRRVGGPAGPPPPKSWLTQRDGAGASSSRLSGSHHRITDRHLGSLPGLYLPPRRSLEHLTLKALAKNWEWHKEYDQFYLATLPRRYKEALLSYVSAYNDRGIDCEGLQVLFLDETELDGATGAENITHLDLGTAVGRALKLKELKDALTKRPTSSTSTPTGRDEVPASWDEDSTTPSAAPASTGRQDVPESWDEDTTLATPLSLARFPSLTHLSLSHPAVASWKGLLALAPHLVTLTHLSLAYWPVPCITPNSKTAYRESPAGNIDYGASNFYSFTDGDLSEAAGVLKRVSRATYCLQWLDLTGCSDWIQALGRKDGPDWYGAWRGLETVKVGQGWTPRCLGMESSLRWRQIWEGVDDPWAQGIYTEERMALKKELLAWVKTEDSISSAQAGVDMIVRSAMKSSVAGDTRNVRTRRVKFDRGYDGWWVEDAVKHMVSARFLAI